MALSAYFDASGNESDQKYVVVAGFVSSVEMWVEFDKLWRERLGRDGVEYFHAVEFAHSKGQFDGWRDQRQRRESLLGDLMDILKRNVSRKFADVVVIEALNERMAQETKDRFHINAYALTGRTCVGKLRQWLLKERWQTVPELIFEEGDIGYGLLSKTLIRDGFPKPIFKPKKARVTDDGLVIPALTPLQAADWLAYEIFLATKSGSINRWPMREFITTPGDNVGIYEAHDIERLESMLNTPRDKIIIPDRWEEW